MGCGVLIYPSRQEWRIYGRVVELVDSLDSGSSVHCGRAGSSPASPTIEDSRKTVSFFVSPSLPKRVKALGFPVIWELQGFFGVLRVKLICLQLFLSISVGNVGGRAAK